MKTISDIQDMLDELQELANKSQSKYINHVRSGDKVLADMEYQILTFHRGQISMLEWVVEDELRGVDDEEVVK